MNKFKKELYNYILDNSRIKNIFDTPPFKYNEITTINFEVAYNLYIMFQQNDLFQEALEKEKDYSRLLKKENQELQKSLNSLCNNNSGCHENDVNNDKNNDKNEKDSLYLKNIDEKGYLS